MDKLALKIYYETQKTTLIGEMSARIRELETALEASHQSECDAIKLMVAAMEQLKKRDHTAKSKHPEPN